MRIFLISDLVIVSKRTAAELSFKIKIISKGSNTGIIEKSSFHEICE